MSDLDFLKIVGVQLSTPCVKDGIGGEDYQIVSSAESRIAELDAENAELRRLLAATAPSGPRTGN
jgi:hypothetical protein